MHLHKLHFIVVAAGKGKRFSSEIPKQFLKIHDKTLAWYTLNNLHNAAPTAKLTLVIAPEHTNQWKEVLSTLSFQPHAIIHGGAERFDSVRNGISAASENEIVAIHDIARPLIRSRLIQEGYQLANERGIAIPILPIHDALIYKTNKHISYVDRTAYFRIQTPQFFKGDIIQKIFTQIKENTYPDEASAALACGYELHFFEGDPFNIKLTYPSDIEFIRSFLKE